MTEQIDEDTLQALKNGAEWYKRHREHVDRRLERYVVGKNRDVSRVGPSGSDLHRPELWLDFHWMWFFREANKWL